MFIFKARLLIFWLIGHSNDLVTWYACHNDRTRLTPGLGCGSLRPPHENITVKYPMTDRVKHGLFEKILINTFSPSSSSFIGNSIVVGVSVKLLSFKNSSSGFFFTSLGGPVIGIGVSWGITKIFTLP